MNRILKKMESMFMAVAYAEAGERETALKLAGLEPANLSGVKQFFRYLENCFAAVAFAEENCHQYADPGNYRHPAPGKTICIHTFLRDVGLQNVQVRYGVALI